MGLGFRKSYTLYKGIEKNDNYDVENLEQIKLIFSKFLEMRLENEKRLIEIEADSPNSIKNDEDGLHDKNEDKSHEFNLKLSDISKEIFLGHIDDYKKGSKNAIKEYEYLMFIVKNIYKFSNDIIEWNEVRRIPEPFNINELGPNALIEQSSIDAYEPSLVEKAFKSKMDKKKEYFKLKLREAMQKDEYIYNAWRELIDLAEDILKGRVSSYFKAIKIINPFEDLLELGIDFEFGADDSNIMHVEYVVDSREIIPYYKLTSSKMGVLNKSNFSREEYNNLVKDYIAGCAIRIARELFALIPINEVIVHVVDHKFNTNSRINEKITVLSADIRRELIENLDFDKLKPIDILEALKYNMNFNEYDGLLITGRILLANQ